MTVLLFTRSSITYILTVGCRERLPYTVITEFLGIFLQIILVKSPPTHYKQLFEPIFYANTFSSVSKFYSVEFKIYLAPSFFNKSTCSCFLTILITSTPSFGKTLFIILPNADAAAVITTHFYFLYLTISSIPMTVNGLTMHIEPCSKDVSSDNGRHS